MARETPQIIALVRPFASPVASTRLLDWKGEKHFRGRRQITIGGSATMRTMDIPILSHVQRSQCAPPSRWTDGVEEQGIGTVGLPGT
jgi:hypothetical protein